MKHRPFHVGLADHDDSGIDVLGAGAHGSPGRKAQVGDPGNADPAVAPRLLLNPSHSSSPVLPFVEDWHETSTRGEAAARILDKHRKTTLCQDVLTKASGFVAIGGAHDDGRKRPGHVSWQPKGTLEHTTRHFTSLDHGLAHEGQGRLNLELLCLASPPEMTKDSDSRGLRQDVNSHVHTPQICAHDLRDRAAQVLDERGTHCTEIADLLCLRKLLKVRASA
mmetsp:Transcript_87415/g.187497  ORF Transcript_87415/g.187497 Transcript_87415/m.187497 type:complete len:222 (+) Transcript_87415:1237-1902(+)